MAAKVNTRFVVILVSVLVVLAGAGIIAAKFALQKSASDHAKAGDEAFAAGDFPAAARYYSNAVNEDQANIEYLRKWLSAVEKTTPQAGQQYRDAYQTSLRLALAGLAKADVSSYESQRRNLAEFYDAMTTSPSSLGDWEYMATLASETMERFQGSEADRKKLGRYRGLALAAALALKGQRTAEEIAAARGFLTDAVEADPKDEEAFLAAVELDLFAAREARERGEGGKADQIVLDVKNRLEEYVATNKPAPGSALRLFRMRFSDEAALAQRGETLKQVLERENVKGALVAAIEAFEQSDPAKVDGRQVLQLAVSGGENLDDLRPRVRELISKIESAQADNSRFLRAYGEVLLNLGRIDEAVAVFDRVTKLPTPPLSLKGLVLEQDKAISVSGQAEAMFVAWQRAPDVAQKEAYTKRLKEYRDALVALIGEKENRVAAIDARLAYVRGDLPGARTLISKYNDDTARNDINSVYLEGEIMRKLGNDGAARTAFQRVLALQASNVRALLALADLEAQDRNYEQARNYLQQASDLLPNEESIKRKRDEIDIIVRGVDPVMKELVRIEGELLSGPGRDLVKGSEELNKLLTQAKDDPRVAAVLANVLASTGKRDEALAVVNKGLAKDPKYAQLIELKKVLSSADPVQAELDAIDNMVLTDIQKNIRKFQILMRMGRREQAREYLKAAAAIDPKNPDVIEYQFLEALASGDPVEIDRLVKLAEDNKTDQLGGVTYRVRRDLANVQKLRAEARTAEEAGDQPGAARLRSQAMDVLKSSRVTLRQITEADRSNVIAWRLLGAVDLELSEPAAAVDSFSKAVAIRPGDVASINGYVRALTATGALDKALEQARKSEADAGGNEEFRALWLALESDAPGGNRDKALEVRRAIAQREPDNIRNRMALATLLLNTRNFAEAQKEIDAIRENGGGLQAVSLQAQAYVMQGDAKRAFETCRDYVESIPEAQRSIAPYLEFARLMRRIGRIDAAMAFYESGKTYQDPKLMEVDREVGDVLYGAKAYAEAVAVYEKVLAAGFKDEKDLVLARIVEGYLNLGQPDKAGEALAKAGDRAQSNATLLLLNARIAASQEDRAKARRLLDQAVAADRANPAVFVARADFNQVDPQMMRDVEADLREALRLAPAYTPARIRLVQLFVAQGNQNEAIKQLREGVSADPTNDQLRQVLIEALVQTSQPDEAGLVVDDTLRLRPDDVQWMLRGSQLMTLIDKPQRAVEYARRAWEKERSMIPASVYVRTLLAIEPPDTRSAFAVIASPELDAEKNIDALLMRARVHLAAKDPQKAFADVSKAVGLIDLTKPELIRAFFNVLPEVYPEARDRVAAVNALEKNRAFDGWMRYQANLTRLSDPISAEKGKTEIAALYEQAEDTQIKFVCAGTLGAVAYQAKEFENAVAWYRKALELNPNDPEINNNLAYTLAADLGRPQEAVEHAQRAIAVVPDSAVLLDTLGTVYLGVGDLEKAGAALMRGWSRATNPAERMPILVHLAQVRARENNVAELQKVLEAIDQLQRSFPGLEKGYEDQIQQLRDKAR